MCDRFAQKTAAQLFSEAASRETFLAALEAGASACPALLWRDPRPDPAPFAVRPPAPWQPDFVDALADPAERPGQHPLHAAGAYYCLDLSSVFEASVLSVVPPGPSLLVDVCASPGGKSLFAWRALSPAHLVANEVIGKRLGALTGNLTRCRIDAAEVTRLDPSALAARFSGAAEVVLVDAPCSGQSLRARGIQNPGCFHPVNVNACANRQRRILAESARIAAPGGYLAYMTCTYSRDENEAVAAWFLARFPEYAAIEVPRLAAHRSPRADFPCYRLWPFEGRGAGGFTVLLRRADTSSC